MYSRVIELQYMPTPPQGESVQHKTSLASGPPTRPAVMPSAARQRCRCFQGGGRFHWTQPGRSGQCLFCIFVCLVLSTKENTRFDVLWCSGLEQASDQRGRGIDLLSFWDRGASGVTSSSVFGPPRWWRFCARSIVSSDRRSWAKRVQRLLAEPQGTWAVGNLLDVHVHR